MANYQKMYITLFRALTLAIRLLELRGDALQAALVLKNAQAECESIYLDSTEEPF